MEWISILVSVIGIAIGAFVAYHVYTLSRQQTFRSRFLRREKIQQQVEELLYKIRNGNSSKVELINISKYDTYYPHSNEKNRDGYTYIGAELKGYHFAGVEFFCEIFSGNKIRDGVYRRLPIKSQQHGNNILMTGVVPYEWIEYIQLRGNDTSFRPQFYVHFLGKDRYPYKTNRYYLSDLSTSREYREITLE